MMASLKLTGFRACVVAVAMLGMVSCGDDDDGGTTADAAPSGGADGAADLVFNVMLTPQGEPSVCAGAGASAMGSATVTIAADGSSIKVENFSYTGLSGAATMAHIHAGDPGENGGVVLPFSSVTSPINQTFHESDYAAAAGAPTTWAAFVTSARQGHSYLNVHTAACGAGEIRGQIAAQ